MADRELFMRESDAFTWRMERDPQLRSTIVTVAWLSGTPDWDRVVDRLDRASRLVPSFRMVVVEPPAQLATPRWVLSPDFDLSWHVRRIDAPAPRTPATVVELARVAAMAGFDPARPLWEFTLVENLVGGRSALLMKFHHALTDGIGGMELAPLLFDLEVDAPPPPGEPAEIRGDHLSSADLVRQSIGEQARRLARVVGHQAGAAPGAALRTARHPVSTVGDVVATAASVARTVAPVTATLSPLMSERSLGRRLDMLTVPLDRLRAAADAGQGTLNAAFLAAVTSGLARYHERSGAPVDRLRMTMPVSIRSEGDPIGGNRITLQRFVLPVGTGDLARRFRAIGETCRAARGERSLPHTNAIAGVLNVLPSGVVGDILKHVDFVASNVPGIQVPVHLAGAEVLGFFAWGPTIGAALNVTLLSYNGTCCIGATIDTAAVTDARLLVDCLQEGFEEVLAFGGGGTVAQPLATGAFGGRPRGSRGRQAGTRPRAAS